MVDNAVHKWSELAVVRYTVPVAGGERIRHDEAALGTRHGYIELAGVFLILPFGGVTLVRIAFGVMLLPFKTYGFCNVLATRGSSIGTRGAVLSRVREGKSRYCFTATSALFRSMRY